MRVRTDLHTNTIFPANAGNPSISTVRSDGFVFWRGEMATWLSSHKWRDKHWRFWLNESQWQSCWVSFSFFLSFPFFFHDWLIFHNHPLPSVSSQKGLCTCLSWSRSSSANEESAEIKSQPWEEPQGLFADVLYKWLSVCSQCQCVIDGCGKVIVHILHFLSKIFLHFQAFWECYMCSHRLWIFPFSPFFMISKCCLIKKCTLFFQSGMS